MKLFTSIKMAIVLTILFSLPLKADTLLNAMKKQMHSKVHSCLNSQMFFIFRNPYAKNQTAIYAMSELIAAETNLPHFPTQMSLPKGDSEVYGVTFKDVDRGASFGVVHLHTKNNSSAMESIDSLCEVTSSCDCTPQYCITHMTTNGVKCALDSFKSDSLSGTPENPYVVILK